MARRNTQPSNDEATEPTPETTTATETVETTDAPIDLGPFQAAVEAAVAAKDESTGEVPADSIEAVNVEYRKLDGIKPKNAAKGWVEDQIKASIMPPKLDAVTARAYSMVKDNLTAGGKSTGDKAPADPTAAYVAKVAALRLALSITESQAPEGDDLSGKIDALVSESESGVSTYGDWLANEAEDKGDAPEVSPVVRTAFKLAQGKASGGGRVSGGSGVRRDIGKHISEYFADKESGHFATVAEIANFKSSEYGDDHPSQGAVSARVFAEKLTVPGIAAVAAGEAGEGKPRGARKL